MRYRTFCVAIAVLLGVDSARAGDGPAVREIPAGVLRDKVQGAILGEIFGNLNGLRHEMKYIAEPGQVESYVPNLAGGARTDDDTDIEWTYHIYMEKDGVLLLPPARISEIWKKHVNRGIWCGNLYARGLMDLGIEPPLTGRIAVNPWSVFNVWGQFGTESFGVMSPGMPRTGCKIGLHYAHVAVDGEPVQATQYLDTMFALAYFESDVEKLIEAGLKATDEKSEMRQVIEDVRKWVKEDPSDWKATRKLLRDKWSRFKGDTADRNGVLLNVGAATGAILYGKGDFAETVRLCFNFGWDADCTAATAGTMIGLIKGRKWMDAQGWQVKDAYANTTRENLPNDETIIGYGERVYRLARKVILEQGGKVEMREGKEMLIIRAEEPGNLEALASPVDRTQSLKSELLAGVEKDLESADDQIKARAAYLAMVLGETERLAKEKPEAWKSAITVLKEKYPKVITNLYDSPAPRGALFKERAKGAGVDKPVKR